VCGLPDPSRECGGRRAQAGHCLIKKSINRAKTFLTQPSGEALKLLIHSHHVLPRVKLNRARLYRPPWAPSGRRQSGLATFGQRGGAVNFLEDFTEDITDTTAVRSITKQIQLLIVYHICGTVGRLENHRFYRNLFEYCHRKHLHQCVE
jgi:hypothetical protein